MKAQKIYGGLVVFISIILTMASVAHADMPEGWAVYANGGKVYCCEVSGSPVELYDGSAANACWSADGRYIFFIESSGDIWAMNNDGSDLRQLTDDTINTTESPISAYRPDPEYLLYVEGNTFYKINAWNGDKTVIHTDTVNFDGEIAISTDGTRLAARDGGDLYKIAIGGAGSIYAPRCSASISPDGQYLTKNWDGHVLMSIYTWDQAYPQTPFKDLDAPGGISWDNQRFAVNSDDYVVYKIDSGANAVGLVRVSDAVNWQIGNIAAARPDFFLGALPYRVRIMPLGDSITKGSSTCSEPDTYLNCTGYRDYLWHALTDAGFIVDFVGSQGGEFQDQYTHDNDHEGHGGWTPDGIDNNISGWLNTYYPDIVLLHIGTNNTSQTAEVESILNKIDAYEAANKPVTVILAMIINRMTYHSATTAFNDTIEAMAVSRITGGDDIIIVDMENGAGINYSTDMDDEKHPNALGYEKMADAWYPLVVSALNPSNTPPTITSTPVTTANVNFSYTYNVNATGYPTPNFNLISAPSGMNIDPNSGVLSWVPTSVGDVNIAVEASNAEGSDTQQFTITVSEEMLTEPGIVPIESITATRDAGMILTVSVNSVTYDVGAGDLVIGTSVRYNSDDSIYTGGNYPTEDADNFDMNDMTTMDDCSYIETMFTEAATTFIIFENGGNDNIAIQGIDSGGNLVGSVMNISAGSADYGVTGYLSGLNQSVEGFAVTMETPVYGIRMTDGGPGTDPISISAVADSNTNVAPTIISTPVTEAIVGQSYTYDVDATGNPAPTYSLISAPNSMTINPSSGVISWTPSATGDFDVTAGASNGISPDANQMFTITVSSEPPAPPAGLTPITSITADGTSGVDPISLTSVTIGSYTVNVDDLRTGTGSGTGGSGTYPVENADNFNITSFASLLNPHDIVNFGGGLFADENGDNPDFIIFENGGNDTGTIQAIFSDDSLGQPVSFSAANWGDTGFDSTVGAQDIMGMAFEIRDLLDADGNNLTNSSVIKGIRLSSSGLDPSCVCAVISGPAGSAPVITSSAITTATVGLLYRYDVDATGSPAPTYSLITAPAGMTINSTTGMISWTPSSVGDVNVTVGASNGNSPDDQQNFTISVTSGSTGQPIIIMPLGDSITKGSTGLGEPESDKIGYRWYLHELLLGAGYNFDFVGSEEHGSTSGYVFDYDHEGHGGWTDTDIANTVYGFLEDVYNDIGKHVEIILLHIGTNGLDPSPDDVNDILDEIDQYESDYGTSITVFLARIINHKTYSSTVTQFNDNIEALALDRVATLGDDIIMVDMEDGAGIDYPNEMTDSIHPNLAAYEKMANLWFAHLDAYLAPGECPNSMSHYWHLDEDSPWYMDAYGINDGFAVNYPAQTVGMVGYGQEFDGIESEINIADDSSFDWGPTDSFSIEFWMKKDTTCPGTSSNDNNVIVGRAGDGGGLNHWWVGVNCNAADEQGVVKFNLLDSGGGAAVFSTTNVLDGRWHHVVAVRDGTTGQHKIYVDGGEPEGAVSHTYSTGFDASTALNIGWIDLIGGYRYEGIVDELAIYNDALTTAEIQLHYDNGLAGLGYCTTVSLASPVITSTAVTNGYIDHLYQYDVDASGIPAPTYALVSGPNGMAIDVNTGLIQWVPDVSQAGNNPVEVMAQNTEGSDTQSFNVYVTEAPPCPNNMVHYWKLDETDGSPYEDSVGAADASCTSCPVSTSGQVNNALNFDGSSESLLTSTVSNPTSAITVMAWINPDSTASYDRGILSKADAFVLEVESSGSEISFSILDDGTHYEFESDDAGNTISTGIWTHVAVTFDGTTVTLYLDGDYVDSATGLPVSSITNSSAGYSIGWTSHTEWGSNRYFDGKIDEVAVFDRALGAAEIQQLYDNGLAGQGYCPGPDNMAVPDVIDLPQAQAESDIAAAGLVVGSITTDYSDTIAEGNVISTVPSAGTMVPQGSIVDMVVSLGSGTNPPVMISGYVLLGDASPVPGVLVSETGGDSDTTDSNGYYELEVPYESTTTVTPTLGGYAFSPVSRTYENITANQSGMYIATPRTYTISGSASIEGVTMQGLPGDPLTDSNGFYTVDVNYGWNGTVTPTKVGYTFDPISRTYSSVDANYPNEDYTAIIETFIISGYVLDGLAEPLEGALLQADNGGGSDSSDANGYYEVVVDCNWSGSIAPTLSGYSFTPVIRDYHNVTSDITSGNNFIGSYMTYNTINGYVKEPDGNTPVTDVFIDYGDGNTVTDVNGFYSIAVPQGWSGTLTPSLEGWFFEPNRADYSNIVGDVEDANYAASMRAYMISGYVTETDGLTPIGDVNVYAENGGGYFTNKYGGGSDMTDGNGFYELMVDYHFTGSVIPEKLAYAFDPCRIDYNNVEQDFVDQDYAGNFLTYAISGCVKNECGVPLSGIVVTANNGGSWDTTDANGCYQVWVDYNWGGTVTPSNTSFSFEPLNRSYVDVLADVNDANFTGYNPYDFDCDGSIGNGDVGVFSDNWLSVGPDLICDVYKADGANTINFYDWADFTNAWLENTTKQIVIVDNNTPGTSYTGTWEISAGPDPYGENSFWSYDGARYRWSFTATRSAAYRVSMWWTSLSTRSTSIPVYVWTDGNLIDELTIDQTINGGMWNVLGQYPLEAGIEYTVTIIAPDGTPPSTCADAVMFEQL